jgi:hypothetical protein
MAITVVLHNDASTGVEGLGAFVVKLHNAAGEEIASATTNSNTHEFEGTVEAGMTATFERWTQVGDLHEKLDAVVVGGSPAPVEVEEAVVVEEAAPVVENLTPAVVE